MGLNEFVPGDEAQDEVKVVDKNKIDKFDFLINDEINSFDKFKLYFDNFCVEKQVGNNEKDNFKTILNNFIDNKEILQEDYVFLHNFINEFIKESVNIEAVGLAEKIKILSSLLVANN